MSKETKVRMLNKKRPYAQVYGIGEHSFEQDGLRYNVKGECIDDIPEDFEEPEEHSDEDTSESTVFGNPEEDEVDEE